MKIQPKNKIIDQLNEQMLNKSDFKQANINSYELKKSGNLGFLMEISEDDLENQSQSSQLSKNSVGFGQSINNLVGSSDVKSKSSRKRAK